MIPPIGTFLTGFAALLALFAAFAAWRAQKSGAARWKSRSLAAAQAAAGLLFVAVGLLLFAFLADHFEIKYVYSHSSRLQPIYLKISALWAGSEGSLLLWSFMQALFSALAIAGQVRRKNPTVYTAALVLNLLTFFFTAITLIFQNPFTEIYPLAADGVGMNPLLRHPGMIFHPPAMYIGYVGLSIPFAFAVAALASRDYGHWVRPLHAWTLFSWLGLGVGLLLGMRWAYDVLGWGGYWGWDPVENAGLMPWLTSTALLHGFVLQDEKRGFRGGNLFLAILSYVLVLFGTFITRSGMIQSVHAYSFSNVRFVLLAGVAAAALVPLFLALRNHSPSAGGQDMPALFSRVGLFYLTVVILLTLTASVLLGTLLPTLSAWLTPNRIGITGAWFDQVTGPQFALLIFLMGACPLAALSLSGHLRRAPLYGSLAAGAAFSAFTIAFLKFTRPFSVAGFFLIGFAVAASLIKLVQGVLRRSQAAQMGLLSAAADILSRQKRTYAGLITHLGVILLALGIVGSRAYATNEIVTLSQGESVAVGGYELEYSNVERNYRGDVLQTQARLSIRRGGARIAQLRPILNRFPENGEIVTVPAVRSSVRDDLYVIFAGWANDGQTATFQIFINPLINFVWLGGLLFLAGAYLALAPRFSRKLPGALYLLIGAILLGVAVWAIWGVPRGVENARFSRPAVGTNAPSLEGLALLDGSQLDVPQGKIWVVNFWAPWCPACLEELPALQRLSDEYAHRGLGVVGIAYQSEQFAVRETAAKYALTVPLGMDDRSQYAKKYAVSGVPETYIIDPSGTIVYAQIGQVDFDSIRAAVEEILAAQSAAPSPPAAGQD